MSMRLLFVSLLMTAAVAAAADAGAQTAPVASDSWSRPASASSAGSHPSYGNGPERHESSDSSGSHFKFKEKRDARPQTNAALEATGKAGVMGGNEVGRDGRPTVSCAQTPMDPACR